MLDNYQVSAAVFSRKPEVPVNASIACKSEAPDTFDNATEFALSAVPAVAALPLQLVAVKEPDELPLLSNIFLAYGL